MAVAFSDLASAFIHLSFKLLCHVCLASTGGGGSCVVSEVVRGRSEGAIVSKQ